MRAVFLYIVAILLLFLPTQPAYSFYDPLSVPNNKFGIHIADTNDIPDVFDLVNSTRGDWGYVTLVIPETDRNSQKWQTIFDDMRRLHLIPIVRLATRSVDDHWTKPTQDSIKDWIPFLTSLNWPIENRYVILFNEPNHAKEWGGTVNSKEYAEIAANLARRLKESSGDFYILPAGLDASAANDGQSMDGEAFLREVVSAKPEFLSLLDGWTSHSYPNPGFSGSPNAWGRGTLRTFYWELDLLRSLGLKRNLPVFITETGWIHSQGKVMNNRLLSPEAVAENLQVAAQAVWSDPNVIAVTPFVFSYQGEPFDHFSWKELGGTNFYAQYYGYQGIPKIPGQPKQRQVYEFSMPLVPDALVAGSTYTLTSEVINTGQGILNDKDSQLIVDFARGNFRTLVDPLPYLEPGETGTITVHVKTPAQPGAYPMTVKLRHYGDETVLDTKTVTLVAPPSFSLRAQLGWRKTSDASNVSVLVYAKDDKILQKFSGLALKNGEVKVLGLADIVPGEVYRVVMLVPYYLPRQEIVALKKDVTTVAFKRFLPFDIDADGALTLADLIALIKSKPNTILSRFLTP